MNTVSSRTLFFKSDEAPIWDTWVVFHGGIFFLYYLSGPYGEWDGVGLATSSDGVCWRDHGKIIDVAADVVWLGSGAIWSAGNRFIMNLSEWRGPSAWEGTQTIFFAESSDLLHWTRLGPEHDFRTDPRWYDSKGRWDNIWPLPRSGGGYFGYWAATANDGKIAVGFGESADGVTWTALPPVYLSGCRRPAEIAAIQEWHGKYYALISASSLIPLDEGVVTAIGETPTGPLFPAPKNQRLLVGNASYFTRFVATPHGLLVNHHSYETGAERLQAELVHLAPLKRAEWDMEGTLRLKWWEENERAKDRRVQLTPALIDTEFDPHKTLILEGVLSLPPPGSSPFLSPLGLYLQGKGERGTGFVFKSNSLVAYGDICRDGTWFERKGYVDRELPRRDEVRFRLIRKGRITELYLDDYLMQCYCLPEIGTARVGLLGPPEKYRDLAAWYCAP